MFLGFLRHLKPSISYNVPLTLPLILKSLIIRHTTLFLYQFKEIQVPITLRKSFQPYLHNSVISIMLLRTLFLNHHCLRYIHTPLRPNLLLLYL